jgi:hypothetical protein
MPWSKGSVILSDGCMEATRDVLNAGSSAPDESTHHRCNASEQLCQRIFNGYVTWRALDELTPRKNIALVDQTLPFSLAVSERLFGCLGVTP